MSAKNGKKKWFIVIAVVVAMAIGGIAIFHASNSQQVESKGSVEQIKKRTIVNSISGNGKVESANTENVKGNSFGLEIETIHVKEGDIVEAGDLICTFNIESIEEGIQTIKESIAETTATKNKQLAEYNEQIAENEASYETQIETASANLSNAKKELINAETLLIQKQGEYELYLASPEHTERDLEAIQMQVSMEGVKMSKELIQIQIDAYQAQVDYLEKKESSSLKEIKAIYVEQMDNAIKILEEQLVNLEEQKENAVVYAGMSGVVTSVNASGGSIFLGDSIVTIEDVENFIIEAQVEEYDIADIAVGMKVLIKTDATREQELEGVITFVAPRATNSATSSMSGLSSLMGMDTSSFTGTSQTATYLVKMELKEPNERLRLGMNAKTSIITQESVDVWSVPYDAVYTREDGSTYVEEVNGKDEEGNWITRELDIEVGIQGTYYVEVISEQITENTKILVPDAQGSSSIEELLNMMGADAGI